MLPPETLLGRYRIEHVLGSGGMGVVYRAVDTRLGRAVALKVLSAHLDIQHQHRLETEARTASSLNHPNILTVYEIAEEEGVRYIATEFIEGTTLRRLLKQRTLSPGEALNITEHICSGLAAAHESGIVHRDVKPENIMIRNDGYLKILDFGLAKFTKPGSVSEEMPTRVDTEANTAVGTVRYMAPEQARGQEVDARADIWSTGVVLYEMLSGKVPFNGPTDIDTVLAILSAQYAPLALLSDENVNTKINAVLSRALAKDVSQRFASMREFLTDLRSLQAELDQNQPTTHIVQALTPISGPAGLGSGAEDILRFASPGAPSHPNNLPAQVSPLLGRESELEEVTALLRSPEKRLVTLTGPGGTGKTRLGLEACRYLLHEFPDGIFFVPLESITDPERIPNAIAQALGIREAGPSSIADTIQQELRGKKLLLFLDNFEQVVSGAPGLSKLLSAAQSVTILISSREILRIQGEQEFFVPPLPVPNPSSLPSLEALEKVPSIQLFVNRAKAVLPGFQLTKENADVISQICVRLEGLPLAIELAAARIRVFSPQALLERLRKRLPFLTGSARDLPRRQQTMMNAIEWGYQLLSEQEKSLFSRISVFSGGFTLQTAEKVTGEPEDRLVELLESLLEKSFIKRDTEPAEMRYSTLEILREYGFNQLQESGKLEQHLRNHAACFLSVVENASAEIAAGNEEWLSRLEKEHDNIRVALGWSLHSGEAAIALRLAGSLWWFWYLHGHYTEGRKWIQTALDSNASFTPIERGRALVGSGALAFLQCEYSHAEMLLNQSLELARTVNDRETSARALQFLGSVSRERGLYEAAVLRHQESLEHWTELNDTRGIARSLNYIGFAAWLQGDFPKAQAVCEESLRLFRQLKDQEGIAWALLNFAAVAHYQGRLPQAEEFCRQSLVSSRAVEYKEGLAWALNIFGINAVREGHWDRAHPLLKRSLELHWSLGDRWRAASVLEALAATACGAAEYVRAATLLSAAEALRQSMGTPLPPVEKSDRDAVLDAVERVLDPAEFSEAQSHGAAMPIDRVIAYVLALDDPPA